MMRYRGYLCALCIAVCVRLFVVDPAHAAGNSARQHGNLTARELGVIINEDDPLSIDIGEYYRKRRAIPAENIVRVRFAAGSAALGVAEFARIKAQVDKALPAHVQALALTWAE